MLHFPSISEDEFLEGCQAFSRCAVEAPQSRASTGLLLVDIVSGALVIEKEYTLAPHDHRDGNEEEEATSTANATEPARDERAGLTDDDDDHEVRSIMPYSHAIRSSEP
jgi:hypothetical protein